MKKLYRPDEVPNALEVLRRAGYSAFRDPQSHEDSFVLRLTSEFYPRFHVYVQETREHVAISLHLDQKKPSYGDGPAHGGEYSGPLIEQEMARIDSWVRAVAREFAVEPVEASSGSTEKKKPWWWPF